MAGAAQEMEIEDYQEESSHGTDDSESEQNPWPKLKASSLFLNANKAITLLCVSLAERAASF